VRDKVSHPYKTSDNITVLYIFRIYILVKQTAMQKILNRFIAGIPGVQSDLNFFMNAILICCGYSEIFELLPHFRNRTTKYDTVPSSTTRRTFRLPPTHKHRPRLDR
jgi:exonuclease V gamma subunit